MYFTLFILFIRFISVYIFVLFICWLDGCFIYLFFYLFIYLIIYLIIYLFIYLFIYLSIYLFIYLFIKVLNTLLLIIDGDDIHMFSLIRIELTLLTQHQDANTTGISCPLRVCTLKNVIII